MMGLGLISIPPITRSTHSTQARRVVIMMEAEVPDGQWIMDMDWIWNFKTASIKDFKCI